MTDLAEELPAEDPDAVRGFGQPFVLALVLVLAAELCLLALAWSGGLWGWLALLGHVAVLVGLGLYVRRLYYRRGEGQAALGLAMALACTAAMGPVGALGFLLAGLLRAQFRKTATPVEEWYRTLFPDFADEEEVALAARIREGREAATVATGVAPFIDVLRLGSRDQKEAVLAMLARRFRPEFAPALKLALEDPVPSVRVQAATAAAQINNDVLARSMRLTAQAARQPKDAEAWRALARHEEMVAGLGLLDADQEAETRRRAVARFTRVLELLPGDREALTAIARNRVAQGDLDAALETLMPLLGEGQGDRAMLAIAVDALFRQGRFAEIHALVEAHAGRLAADDPLSLWLDNGLAEVPEAVREGALA